ncbi:MAG: DUF309 domain-containing protein [Spirulina sp. SIO3F2]|nr:DUF309 domain-containing protein [Spirulina sp. SIO3F2]
MSEVTLAAAVEQFNVQEFYACHDILEAMWVEALEPDKTFYQGMLQVAVGCYHLQNLNWRGAATLLGEGLRRLRGYQPDYQQIDVTQLFEQSLTLLETVQQTPPEALSEVAAPLPQICWLIETA